MPLQHRAKHLTRYYQIGEVLARHGLGYLLDILGLERFVPFYKRAPGHISTPPAHVRQALEELGATFIKLGQLLSTRPDLIPLEYQRELARLQDQAPPIPAGQAEEVLAAELGRPISEVFASFEPEPFAAASIGQAHLATLKDGTEVVVKIRRPGVVEQVEEDLEILQNLAASANRRWALANQYDVVGLAQEFAQTLRSELDYLREGRNAERFAANFADNPEIHIPKVYWETTTSRVLTLERIKGLKINDLEGLAQAKVNRLALARRATNAILKMTFEDGFFHADLHPGNFFIEPNGRIGLVDFGMVGTVDDRTQEQLARLFVAVTSQDTERLVDTILELGVSRQKVDRAHFRRDLAHLLDSYADLSLGELPVEKIFEDLLSIIQRYNLQMPSNLVLLIKMVVMTEGLGTQLSPSFRLFDALRPYARNLMLRQYSPQVWVRRLGQAGLDAAQLGMELPRQVGRLLGEVERGDLEVGVRVVKADPLIRRLERIANRIVLGIIVAAFINGLAVLLAARGVPGWEQWINSLFTVGFIIASMIGGYLAWTILRSGHK